MFKQGQLGVIHVLAYVLASVCISINFHWQGDDTLCLIV